MQIRHSKDLYFEGLVRREHEEPDLTITPEQAETIVAARESAIESCAARYGDSIGDALEEVQTSGRTASFLEFYKGPLSESVLAALLEAGTLQPDAA